MIDIQKYQLTMALSVIAGCLAPCWYPCTAFVLYISAPVFWLSGLFVFYKTLKSGETAGFEGLKLSLNGFVISLLIIVLVIVVSSTCGNISENLWARLI